MVEACRAKFFDLRPKLLVFGLQCQRVPLNVEKLALRFDHSSPLTLAASCASFAVFTKSTIVFKLLSAPPTVTASNMRTDCSRTASGKGFLPIPDYRKRATRPVHRYAVRRLLLVNATALMVIIETPGVVRHNSAPRAQTVYARSSNSFPGLDACAGAGFFGTTCSTGGHDYFLFN